MLRIIQRSLISTRIHSLSSFTCAVSPQTALSRSVLNRGMKWSVELETNHTWTPSYEIIDESKIGKQLEHGARLASDPGAVRDILQKARDRALLRGVQLGDHEYLQGLTGDEASVLLHLDSNPTTDEGRQLLQELFDTALDVKRQIYGNRIVLFAPLYLANYCVNSCTYCSFRGANHTIARDMLSDENLREEVAALERLGHRRLLLLTGEHPKYTFDRFLSAVHVVKEVKTEPCGAIRRVNVEIPSLSVSDFRRLKATDAVGTYTLFQETYHRETFRRVHPSGPKSDYNHRLLTMDRAQTAAIDDVGIGALFGLHDYRFEVLSLLAHATHLDRTFGAGPHTISIPRMRPADNAPDAITPPAPVSDADFKKLVAVIRCAVPYTGMILSTRESPEMRAEILKIGVSQMSAGSRTDVGAYHKGNAASTPVINGEAATQLRMQQQSSQSPPTTPATGGQFELADHRSLEEVIRDLLEHGYLPSMCTACYRSGRTGEAFMKIAKRGDIQNFCHPNSLLTLQEYLIDYASDDTRKLGEKVIERERLTVSEQPRRALDRKMKKTCDGARDLSF